MRLFRPYVMSSAATLAVLYLTLVPQPLPPPDIEIPFADKLVHGLLFAIIAVVYGIDWVWHHRRRWVTVKESVFISVISTLFGGLIEFLQWAMNVGRSGDWGDFLADGIGVAAILLLFLPSRFVKKR